MNSTTAVFNSRSNLLLVILTPFSPELSILESFIFSEQKLPIVLLNFFSDYTMGSKSEPSNFVCHLSFCLIEPEFHFVPNSMHILSELLLFQVEPAIRLSSHLPLIIGVSLFCPPRYDEYVNSILPA